MNRKRPSSTNIIYILPCIVLATTMILPTLTISQWYKQDSPTTNYLSDIHFIDPYVGWAVGMKGTILHTIDGGKGWTLQNSGDTTTWLTGVYAISDSLCWAVGGVELLLKTTNGGASWTRYSFNGVTFDTLWLPRGINFVDQQSGWVSGYYSIGGNNMGIILKTTDGGNTWQKQPYPSSCSAEIISAIDYNRVWFTCGGSLWRTMNGIDWEKIYSIGGELYNIVPDVDFVTPDIGWSTRTFYPAEGAIQRSNDGGSTWLIQHTITFTGGYVYIDFLDTLKGWAVVRSGITVELEIWNTVDGGVSWTRQFGHPWSESGDPNRIYFVDSSNGWVVATEGNIFHTTNGGITAIEDEGRNDFIDMELNIYPNPFNSTTNINFKLADESEVKLILYDVLGNEVSRLIEERKPPGVHQVRVDFNNSSAKWNRGIANGIYYCRLLTQRGTVTKPLIYLK
jgi:photosystem II stability/assembly factor-like uncharacterized protein